MKEVGILIVTYNRLELLQEEIASIRNQTFKDYDIIVVNNCSSDATKVWLNDQKDIHSIHIEPQNIGPAKAFSLGIKFIVEKNYKFCWLMDDDVWCRPDALEQLYKAYYLKDDVGFVCSKVEGVDGCPMNVPNIDVRPTSNGYSSYADMLDHQMVKVIDCTFVSMLISSSIIIKVGLPIGEMYNWGVDTEYSIRISKNHDCYMVNRSVVVHKRLIQKVLDFVNETEKDRISYHKKRFYISYFMEKCKDGISIHKFILKTLYESLNLIIKGKFKHSFIYLFWSLRGLSFNPKINFICNTYE